MGFNVVTDLVDVELELNLWGGIFPGDHPISTADRMIGSQNDPGYACLEIPVTSETRKCRDIL